MMRCPCPTCLNCSCGDQACVNREDEGPCSCGHVDRAGVIVHGTAMFGRLLTSEERSRLHGAKDFRAAVEALGGSMLEDGDD